HISHSLGTIRSPLKARHYRREGGGRDEDFADFYRCKALERAKGIEPSYAAWETVLRDQMGASAAIKLSGNGFFSGQSKYIKFKYRYSLNVPATSAAYPPGTAAPSPAHQHLSPISVS